MKSISELLVEFNDPPYTRERYDADRSRVLARLTEKHGVEGEELRQLIAAHRYIHTEEDPEEEYLHLWAVSSEMGWPL